MGSHDLWAPQKEWSRFKEARYQFPRNMGELPNTPCEINMEPENDGLEDDFPFQTGDF